MICSVPAVKINANQFKEYLTLISMVSAFAFSYFIFIYERNMLGHEKYM